MHPDDGGQKVLEIVILSCIDRGKVACVGKGFPDCVFQNYFLCR